MAGFSIDSRMADVGDIQRQYLYELEIPTIGSVTQDDMIVRVRSAVIPQRGVEPIESNFMGMKQFFPGKPTFSHQLVVDFEEFEDQKVLQYFTSWFEEMNVLDPNSEQSGVASKGWDKSSIARDITLKMYKYDGSTLSKSIKFVKAWPETMSDSALTYTGAESVKFSCTFRFDYWTLEGGA
jgi:hypothetical protein